MGWKEVRNDQSTFKDVSYSGECPRFHKKATVTGTYFGRYIAKGDRQPAYSLNGYICTLTSGLCPQERQCPLMPEKYL